MAGSMMTVSSVAAELGLSKMTVYRLIHARKLGALKVGNSFRIPRASFEAYLDRSRTDGDARD